MPDAMELIFQTALALGKTGAVLELSSKLQMIFFTWIVYVLTFSAHEVS